MMSWFTWAKRTAPHSEFEEMLSWDHGRWARLYDALQIYGTADEGEAYQARAVS
jgi:hypothetical protein